MIAKERALNQIKDPGGIEQVLTRELQCMWHVHVHFGVSTKAIILTYVFT